MNDKWLRFLPVSIQHQIKSRIEGRPNLLNIISNITWLYGDRLLRMGVGLFVSVWIARYLGPEGFGLISYALAFVTLFASISTLGLNEIVVRDLVKTPNDHDRILGSAWVIQTLSTVAAISLAFLAINFVRAEDDTAILIVSILSIAMAFKLTDILKYWFESQVQSKYTVWVDSTVFILVSSIRIGLILLNAPLIAFVWAIFFEAAAVSLGMAFVYVRQGGNFSSWTPKYDRAKKLFNDSWPLLLSSMAIMVYMRIDQIMLGEIINDEAVGIYSAAVRISEVWYFVPMVIASSLFPAIISLKEEGEEVYYSRLQLLYDWMVILALTVALITSLVANDLVILLFGESYSEAAPILSIYIWAGIFVALGVVRGKWLIIENLQHLGYWYIGMAMIVNIALNLILIPEFGMMGAAWATVAAQVTATIIAPALFPSTRISAMMLLRSLVPFRWISLFRTRP